MTETPDRLLAALLAARSLATDHTTQVLLNRCILRAVLRIERLH